MLTLQKKKITELEGSKRTIQNTTQKSLKKIEGQQIQHSRHFPRQQPLGEDALGLVGKACS